MLRHVREDKRQPREKSKNILYIEMLEALWLKTHKKTALNIN